MVSNNSNVIEIKEEDTYAKPNFWFTLFFLSIFFPLVISIGSINVKFVEILAPVFFINGYIRFKHHRRIKITTYAKLFYIALILLIISAIISFLRNPVFSEKLLGESEGQGGIRMYFTIFIDCLVFFTFMWYVIIINVDFTKLLKVLLTVSLVLGYLRLIGAFLHFDIPFVYGVFRYSEDILSIYNTNRIGGLEEAATWGIISLYALTYKYKINFKTFIIFILLFFLELMSGGRTSFFSIVIITFLFLIIYSKKSLKIFSMFAIGIAILFLIVPTGILGAQFNRIFAISGGISGQDIWRSTTYLYYIQNFINNPIIGAGIQKEIYLGSDNMGAFLSSQLRGGGHGAYLSILSTFGILGFTYLLIFIVYGITIAWKHLRSKVFNNNEFTILSFIILLLFSNSIKYYTGLNGFNDPTIFCLVGILLGVISRKGLQIR